MAKKEKKEQVNANNLRSANFSDFEANHTFTKDSKKAEFTRAAIKAGLTNAEIVELGNDIYGEGEMKMTCVNWYRSSDPYLNPGKERYKATGARALEVKSKVIEYYNGLGEDEQKAFVDSLVEAVGIETLINSTKGETLKGLVPADIFPVKEKKQPKQLTEVEKLLKKQKAAEAKAAKLAAELAALEADNAASTTSGDDVV